MIIPGTRDAYGGVEGQKHEQCILGNGVSADWQIRNSRLFLAVFSAVLGNFNFGYSMVYPSPVLPVLQGPDADPRLRMDNSQAALFGSIYTLGAAGGGLGAMLLNDMIGRKMSIMLSAVPSSIGFTSLKSPIRQCEGALGSCPQITAVVGTLTLYVLGLWVPFRWLAIAGGVPAVLMVVLLSFMPSSPRRLLSLGRGDKAEQALRWLRGPDYDPNPEISGIQHSIRMQTKLSWSQLRKPEYYKPILISVVMRFLQQMTGITPILIYLQPIFNRSNVSLLPEYDAALVGAVRLFSVMLAASLMDKAGRKALLYTSSLVMFVASLSMTITSHTTPCPGTPNGTVLNYNSHNALGNGTDFSQNNASIFPVISTMVFIFGYAMGWGPITWLLMSEVLPLVTRGVASGVCVTVSWLTAFALTHAFTLMLDYGLYVPFLLFTVVCVLCLFFTAVVIPETRGRSLEEIENYFRTGRSFTISSRSPSVREST
ncbi:hypothetical protein NQD34_005817 [Periophthalmus magnuspinnatus]|nr:hypothetical protein NQD34_005817 [Periophthalmus magnuspinnatus]